VRSGSTSTQRRTSSQVHSNGSLRDRRQRVFGAARFSIGRGVPAAQWFSAPPGATLLQQCHGILRRSDRSRPVIFRSRLTRFADVCNHHSVSQPSCFEFHHISGLQPFQHARVRDVEGHFHCRHPDATISAFHVLGQDGDRSRTGAPIDSLDLPLACTCPDGETSCLCSRSSLSIHSLGVGVSIWATARSKKNRKAEYYRGRNGCCLAHDISS
jgi:hypothetical protein